MKLNTYILLQYVINIFRVILCPFIAILSTFVPLLKARKSFEASNRLTDGPKAQGLIADACFHVSSEGELQQCLTIIEEYLSRGKLVELVYTSPSVERKCVQLDSDNKNLYSLRLPLLLFPFASFNRWVSAKKFFMCRYDFYSDLMIYGARDDVEFILLSASLKGKLDGSKFLLKEKFSLFDQIYTASDKDAQLFNSLNVSATVTSFEFRLLQIVDRISKSESTFKVREELEIFRSFIEKRDPNSNIILGSAWPNEMKIFSNISFQKSIMDATSFVCIAPHELSEKSIEEFIREIKSINSELDVQILSGDEHIRKGAIVINPYSGILLESFSYFGHSYIGGGHARSIHSVLEPFLSNSMVYCGPKTHRSTEFDFIESYNKSSVKVIEHYEDFFDNLYQFNRDEEVSNRLKLVRENKIVYKEILEKIIC